MLQPRALGARCKSVNGAPAVLQGCQQCQRLLRRQRHCLQRLRIIAGSQLDTELQQQSLETQEVVVSPDRLFSTVEFSEPDKSFKHRPGSVFSAAALVAGTTVGAGILALPYVTEDAGFVASSGAMTGMWLFSVVTGLLVAEVNINTMCQLGRGGAGMTLMAERTLGTWGARGVTASYLFLHGAMLVAYIARAGELVAGATSLPGPAASVAFAAVLGVMCWGLKPSVMDNINSALVALVVLSFLGLLAAAAPGVNIDSLAKANVAGIPKALPVLSLAFVFQNVVPIISTSLEGDPGKIRTAIVAGTGVPLLMFLAWDAAILGSLGSAAGSGADPLQALQADPKVGVLVQAFSFLAVTTSFIGFLFGVSDFIGELLHVPSGKKAILPFVLSVVPPTAFALLYPSIFFSALDYAGTYGVLVLFGIIPAGMAWSERYSETTLSNTRVVPGGRGSLLAVGGIAGVIIANQAFGSLLSMQ